MPAVLGTPPILDSSGQPANGFIKISASRAFDTPQGHITTAWSTARVIDGVATQNGAPWVIPATPEGVWMNLVQDLDGEEVVKYSVVVPNDETITYAQLLYNRGGAGEGSWDVFWWDLTDGALFPPEALDGDMGIDLITYDIWRNEL